MTTKFDLDREKMRAARWVPDERLDAAIDQTLSHLKPRRRPSFPKRMLMASAIVAAFALFLTFAAPPIVRAAGQLYERLFGDVRRGMEDEQAKPKAERLAEQINEIKAVLRAQDVEGASAEIGGVTMSVVSICLASDVAGDDFSGWTRITGANDAIGGIAYITVHYSARPSFDPSYVNFALSIDGVDIPMYVSGALQNYRDGGGCTLTEDEWNDEENRSNSENVNGTYTTLLSFKIDDWMWDAEKDLALKATIDGREVAIPFSFDPQKTHKRAMREADISLNSGGDDQLTEIRMLEANAVPVELTGKEGECDWVISEMAFADDQLSFTAAFYSTGEARANPAAMDYRLEGVTVDGLATGAGGACNESYNGGSYAAIFQYPLCCDSENLPVTSMITMTLVCGDQANTKTVSFKYNWVDQKVILPADASEMEAWTRADQAAGAELDAPQYGDEVGYDLTGLGLTAGKDGVTMTITGIAYQKNATRLEIYVAVTGNVEKSAYDWARRDTTVTINGADTDRAGGGMNGAALGVIYVTAPMSIAEFGHGEAVVVEYPLCEKGESVPADTLRFEFTVDTGALPGLTSDQ